MAATRTVVFHQSMYLRGGGGWAAKEALEQVREAAGQQVWLDWNLRKVCLVLQGRQCGLDLRS